MSDLACPVCGAEFDLAVAFASEADQQALARLAAVSIPLGSRVLQYITLFTPAKQRLTGAKKVKLLMQLLPDLERQAITHKGRDWAVPLPAWAQAIDQMLAGRERLELPMKGHGYLYAVLASMADKHEAAAEAEREHDKRLGPRRGHTSGFAVVGDAVQAAPRPAPRTTPQASSGESPMVRQMKEEIARKKGAQA